MRCALLLWTSRGGRVQGRAETCVDDVSAAAFHELRNQTMAIATLAEAKAPVHASVA